MIFECHQSGRVKIPPASLIKGENFAPRCGLVGLLAAVLVFLVWVLTGCASPSATDDVIPPVCLPLCDGSRCVDDCGGLCECASDLVCNGENYCVAPEICTDTCAGVGWSCGTVCETSCGVCRPFENCMAGTCSCESHCDGLTCGSDGCGGLCECADGLQCNAQEECVDDEGCFDTCQSAGAECGEICGTSCGECAPNEICRSGQCLCIPQCDGQHCGSDGCGGRCSCAAGLQCNGDNLCVEENECTDTCQQVDWVCGEICNVSCGQCAANEICVDGGCECEPHCDELYCGADGCGGLCECTDDLVCNEDFLCVACTDSCEQLGWTCGKVCGEICGSCPSDQTCVDGTQCETAVSCLDCSLVLSLVDRYTGLDEQRRIVLAVDYLPAADEPRPRMFDLFLQTASALTLLRLEQGPALSEADKQLSANPDTGDPWTEVEDGRYRFMALSLSNTNSLEKGRIMTLTFTGDILQPVGFYLEKREQTFAPDNADAVLQMSEYDCPISVSPW